MSERVSRRGFLKGGVLAAGAGVVLTGAQPVFAIGRKATHAIACSSNGLPYIAEAMEKLAKGMDTLDVAVEAVNYVESDPKDMSVGYGGLPNAEGIVELDSCCMHGPTNNAGSVASLRSIKNPSRVARDVLWHTDHVMIVGEGALRFARMFGHKEENLLTEAARKRWLQWKLSHSDNDDWLMPHEKRPQKGPKKKDGKRETGTINFNCCNDKGEVSGVTTTSGLAWKIPGRIGDSPIIGAGLYVDGKIGSAGSTGRGESVIIACGAHTVVEGLRQGMHPKDACLFGVKRVVEMNKMPNVLRANGKPNFQVNFYAVNVKGDVGGASVFPSNYGVGDAKGSRREDTAVLFTSAK
ncbi:MAG: N4-(beta-N-acetylglucosaminyl)-L-asparaginase [Planctomycetota bacterium]|jgi:N4-(beta-N-acetylglucosaminyl)-L-asparaginase